MKNDPRSCKCSLCDCIRSLYNLFHIHLSHSRWLNFTDVWWEHHTKLCKFLWFCKHVSLHDSKDKYITFKLGKFISYRQVFFISPNDKIGPYNYQNLKITVKGFIVKPLALGFWFISFEVRNMHLNKNDHVVYQPGLHKM